jgi:uncharacterized protein
VIELARYQKGPASVVVSRDGDELRFWSSYDDYGRAITEESRIAVADFVPRARGRGRGMTLARSATAR